VFASLCYIGGANPELISYENATLTSAYHYNLATKLRRGVYGSTIGAHLTNDPFMFLNDAVEGYNYDVGLIGATVFFKFTSFNQSGLVEELLANVTAYSYTVTGAAVGQLTPAHASYRPTTNPLTAHDAGASATINVAAFSMRVAGQADIPFGSGAVTGLAYNTLYYVYVNDIGYLPEPSPTYLTTTTKETTLISAASMFVGSILTPLAGAPDTIGNNDGGGGAQIGNTFVLNVSQAAQTGTNGNGAITNPTNSYDGNLTSFTKLTATADGTAHNQAQQQLTGPPGINPQRYSSATLFVRMAIPTNGLNGATPVAASVSYQLNTSLGRFTNFDNGNAQWASGVTQSIFTFQKALPVGINLSQVNVISVVGPQVADTLGSIEMDTYEVWIEVVE
jgi:hypothetical protein